MERDSVYLLVSLIQSLSIMSLDTYKLPLYFLAKVKVKKEVICISK